MGLKTSRTDPLSACNAGKSLILILKTPLAAVVGVQSATNVPSQSRPATMENAVPTTNCLMNRRRETLGSCCTMSSCSLFIRQISIAMIARDEWVFINGWLDSNLSGKKRRLLSGICETPDPVEAQEIHVKHFIVFLGAAGSGVGRNRSPAHQVGGILDDVSQAGVGGV